MWQSNVKGGKVHNEIAVGGGWGSMHLLLLKKEKYLMKDKSRYFYLYSWYFLNSVKYFLCVIMLIMPSIVQWKYNKIMFYTCGVTLYENFWSYRWTKGHHCQTLIGKNGDWFPYMMTNNLRMNRQLQIGKKKVSGFNATLIPKSKHGWNNSTFWLIITYSLEIHDYECIL